MVSTKILHKWCRIVLFTGIYYYGCLAVLLNVLFNIVSALYYSVFQRYRYKGVGQLGACDSVMITGNLLDTLDQWFPKLEKWRGCERISKIKDIYFHLSKRQYLKTYQTKIERWLLFHIAETLTLLNTKKL